MLFHFLSQLESRRDPGLVENDQATQHLDLLIRYLQERFATTLAALPPLLEHGEITFDLLWTLFCPNAIVYTTCIFSEQPKCLIFDFGDEQMIKKENYYILQCRYIDFNGKVFGEVVANLLIPEFRGTKAITSLEVFPLRHHRDLAGVRSDLIKRGQKFTSLNGVHHWAYNGLAHFKKKGQPIKFTAKGRIMVDPISFKDHNPNYERPRVDGLSGRDLAGIRNDVLADILADGLTGRNALNDNTHSANGLLGSRVEALTKKRKPSDIKNAPGELQDEELLLICCPTVLGFSLDRKIWG